MMNDMYLPWVEVGGPHGGPGTHWPCGEQFVPIGQVVHVCPPRPHAKFTWANSGTHWPL
jgi:hypothetical protein